MGGGKGPAPAADADRAFEKRWQTFVHDGFLAGSRRARGEVLALSGARLQAPAELPELGPDNLEVSFAHDQSL